MTEPEPTPSRRRVVRPALWLSGAVAATLLVLGVNGTLASWTQAIIDNSTNTAATGTAVILQEVSGANTCTSASSTTNSSTCATINKYGGTATPLTPGTSQVTTVTFSNTGGQNASTFVATPGTCTSTPSSPNLCTNGDLTVAVQCSPGATFVAGSAWTDLAYTPAAAPPTAAKTHTAASGDLNAAASWTCQFTVALSATASPTDQGITISQPITWTLNK